MKKKYYYSCIIGDIGIAEEDGFITDIYFRNVRDVIGETDETAVIRICFEEIKEYLVGKRRIFDFPLRIEGTEFQKKVWKALLQIDYGTCVSYSDIAKKINCPKAVRAVGMANNKNPIIIAIPCHRVIGKDGSFTGYAGGLDIKEMLLNLESSK